MKLLKKYPLYLLTILIAGCGVPSMKPDSTAIDRPPFDPTFAAKEVAWNEGRVKNDPKGAIGWSQLSAAYLALARATDDNAMAVKSEEAARKSLALRRINNSNAATRLAKAVLEQHRFHEALVADDDALKINPNDAGAQELHAEILAELGRYDEAWKDYDKFHLSGAGLNGLALKARLLEVDGKPDDAEVFLRQSADVADQTTDMSREANAWFHLKLGTLLLNEGKNDEAKEQFTTAVDTNPGDYKSMGFLARVEAASGNLSTAKEWGEKSIAVRPSVEVASLLEDIAAHDGNAEDETKYATMVDQVSHPDMYAFLRDPSKVPSPTSKPHTHDRLYAVYCADHKKNLPDALVAAKKDLKARQDIYAYDTLAWVLHQMGRDVEAKPPMTRALSRGTIDAKMFYHAGMIDAALGNSALARSELSRALKINPQFQYGQQDIARDELEKLGGSRNES